MSVPAPSVPAAAPTAGGVAPPTAEVSAATAASTSGTGGSAAPMLSPEAYAEIIVQYIVMRQDLLGNPAWTQGALFSQASHASVAAVWQNRDDPHVIKYCNDTDNVADEAQLHKAAAKLKTGGVPHKLWIEQPENIPTCLATIPYPRKLVSHLMKGLKLLR